MLLHDLLLETHPSSRLEVAFQDENLRWTRERLVTASRSQALALRANGVQPGDRVVVLAKNRVEYVALYFATSMLGATLVPLNWRLTGSELRWILDDASPKHIVAEPALAGALEGAPYSTFEDLTCEGTRPLDPTASNPDDMAVLMYTSGTSGRPKGAALSHANCLAMSRSWLFDMPLSKGDRFLQVTPLFHVGGMLMILSTTSASADLRLIQEFDPVAVIEILSSENITHTLMVPAMLQWLLQEPSLAGTRVEGLKMIAYGAAPMPSSTLRAAREIFTCDFLQGYGLTETSGVLLTLTAKDHRLLANDSERLRSAGTAAKGCEVRVVDEFGKQVPPTIPGHQGGIGEVVARGANISSGYWQNPKASHEVWEGGWFHTGDLAQIDASGYITIVDRKKDMLLVGGENVYPLEVENVLIQHESVRDVAIIGVPHPIWGEEPLAVVVLQENYTPQPRKLMLHCRQHLARFKCPARIEFQDQLPRNAAGKLMKRTLRAPYWQDMERQI